MKFLSLPRRTSGKRTYGLTAIIDLGIPLRELDHFLNDYHSIIDIAKFGIGSAYVTPFLREKVNLYKEYKIIPYCGGTLFEKCYYQNKIPEYLKELQNLGIEWIEISTGTLDIPLQDRLNIISRIKKDFHIIAEVGSKDSNNGMTISMWKEEIASLLKSGCEYVITEGRESGSSGIYEKSGNIKSNLIKELVKDFDSKKLIFEAPTPKQQMYFINEIGANVNLGNVKPSDVLVLETERCGLRSETLFLEDHECKLLL